MNAQDAGLLLWALRRLGPPRALVEAEQRASVEYLLAMARIYRLGKHTQHAASALVRGAQRAVEPLTRLPRSSSLDAHAETLEVQGRKELARALRQLRDQASQPLTETELLGLAKSAAQLRQAAGRANHAAK